MLRKIPLQNGRYYHIYNRGTEKIEVFRDNYDFVRFLVSMKEFNRIEPVGSLYDLKKRRESGPTAMEVKSGPTAMEVKSGPTAMEVKSGPTANGAVGPLEPLVEIVAYCLMPNHYHFILKQLQERGISEFIKRLVGGYTWYFNHKYDRSGSLFQGKFKSAHMGTDHRLCWYSSYVNCNAEIHGIAKAENWIWSSYIDFIGRRSGAMNNKKIILDMLNGVGDYTRFCREVIREAREIKEERREMLE